MRQLLTASTLLFLTASHVLAEEWRNWFVGPNTEGGVHPLTVETEAEALAIYAGVISTDGEGDEIRFGVRCRLAGPRSDNVLENYYVISDVFIGGLLRRVEVPIRLTGSFDGEPAVDFGYFGFNGGVLIGSARPQLLAKFMEHRELIIASDNGTFAAKISLENANESIAKVKCWGDL